MNTLHLEEIVLGRKRSFFANDIADAQNELTWVIAGSRILVLGAAGSIGGAFVKVLARYRPRALWLVDPDENGLVETVRDLRSSGVAIPADFGTVAIGFGTFLFDLFLKDKGPFDYILNFAALKHVRSERDPYSLMRMLEVNVSANARLLRALAGEVPHKVFAVSSDKAVNPHNLMGATKAFMERVFLDAADRIPFSSARFANVAFSNGSLLQGFLYRLEKRQPLAGPSDIQRYFISHQEAGELCLLSCFLGGNREIFVPRMDPREYLADFMEIAEQVLAWQGKQPLYCTSEAEALAAASRMKPDASEWPCFFSESDTSGEKNCEEFVGESERVDEDRYRQVRVVDRPVVPPPDVVPTALAALVAIKASGIWSKPDLVRIVQSVVPELTHQELGANLDQKM